MAAEANGRVAAAVGQDASLGSAMTDPLVLETDVVTIRLAGKYAGWEAQMDTDPALQTLLDLDRNEPDAASGLPRSFLALLELVQSWTFCDRHGQLVPPDLDGIRQVRISALGQLKLAYIQHFAAQLPNPSGGASSPTSSIKRAPATNGTARRRRSTT